MNIRVAKEEIALLMPKTLSHYADEPRFVPETPKNSLLTSVLAAITWVADLPRRHAVMSELSELSDRELSDIGLSRSDIGRVFDSSFSTQRSRFSI